ncbi:hypothetical protein [Chitinivorax sp. B]|uniref:hypothetical protein n=1 Tax=Chitinivorax sp. B TaxID=2502235 RepID=UPI0010F9AB6B|nr:hypothetical protein [Chitinivorax sp. B]
MRHRLSPSLVLALLTFASLPVAAESTVEELRLPKARESMPAGLARHDALISQFTAALANSNSQQEMEQAATDYAASLWQTARDDVKLQGRLDDRPLYWARLMMTQAARNAQPVAFTPDVIGRQRVEDIIERTSRGLDDIRFQDGLKRILITGFDPFLLDRNVDQSNPSGLTALKLDGKIIRIGNKYARIEAVLAPVRFADFDAGFVENLLRDLYRNKGVDLVATISMGRQSFDLERFPGLRRSADFPDNLNVKSGGTPRSPVAPLLDGGTLTGKEFVEFSLPVAAMQQVNQPFAVNDNHQVTTLKRTFSPQRLAELRGEISVEGSGGGYLSNEISYRSVRLRDDMGVRLPVGHIHTPAIQRFEPETEARIAEQIERMLKAALDTL